MRIGRFLLIFILILISACSLLFIFSEPILKHLATGLVVNQPLVKSDAVVALGGGSPSRVLEAIDIYKEGLAGKIIIFRSGKPEGIDYIKSKNIDYKENADRDAILAEKLGVNQKDIIIFPGRVYSTKEEAEKLKKFALRKGYKSIIITTSKGHTKRSYLIFNRIFKNSGINLIIKPSSYDSFDPNNLEKNKQHWKNVVLEYQKIIYFYKDEYF